MREYNGIHVYVHKRGMGAGGYPLLGLYDVSRASGLMMWHDRKESW